MQRCDLLVVGAGPAGLGAAAEATREGVETVVVDGRPAAGGQYHARARGADPLAGLPAELLHGLERDRLRFEAGAEVWAVFRGPLVAVVREGASRLLAPRTIVFAAGAIERPQPFPGWERPGVIAAGAAQLLLKEHGVVPEGPVVVAGTGPFLLPVAAQLAAAGADLRALVEAQPLRRLARLLPALAREPDRRREALGYARALRGVRRVYGARIIRATLDGVELTTGERIECATLCVGHGFVPRTEIAEMLGCRVVGGAVAVDELQATSIPAVFAAGEVTGVAGGHAAAIEGRIAGLAAARLLGHDGPAFDARFTELARRRARVRRFAERLWRVYEPLPPLALANEDTIVCRCERVTLGAIRAAAREVGPIDGTRALKGALRCAMGPCQGTMCASAVSAALGGPSADAAAEARVRPPLAAVTVAAVAGMELAAPPTPVTVDRFRPVI